MIPRFLAILAIFSVFLARGQAAGVSLVVANYSELPVYSHAVPLDHDLLCQKMGIPKGSPVEILSLDRRQVFRTFHGIENGKGYVKCYLSLPPKCRLEMIVEPARQWADPRMLLRANAAKGELSGEMSNGVLKFSLAPSGWSLGFDPAKGFDATPKQYSFADPAGNNGTKAPNLVMIREGGLHFWVDDKNRGRLSNLKPGDTSMPKFPEAATVERCEAAVSPEGVPSIRVVRRMSGIAKGVVVTETFSLLPGLPVLTHRMHWKNEGPTDLWIAYVGSGDGERGRWGESLMAEPLVQRMKTPLKGYLNGAETRPSWLGPFCKVSMESSSTGCGVGLSTLLRTPRDEQAAKTGAFHGSLLWGINRTGFLLSLIDPVNGQYPHPLKVGGELENGTAFLLTQNGTGPYRQVVEAWDALRNDRSPKLASPCAVFIGGVAAESQSISADAINIGRLFLSSGEALKGAVRLDFNRFFSCVGTAVVTGAPVELVAVPQNPKMQPVVVGKVEKSGEFSFQLNKAFPGADEVPMVLEFRNGSRTIRELSIVETLPVAPELFSPISNASFTDFALMFRWKTIPLILEYDLQWSQSEDFANKEEVRVHETEFPSYVPPADKLPAPGKWYWRVRGVSGGVKGVWSDVRSFTVNNDHSKKPLIRPPGAADPIFTLEASQWNSFTNFVSDMPAGIRRNTAIILSGFVGQNLSVQEACRGIEKMENPIFIKTHPPTHVSLPDLEWIFQNFPNVLGVHGGETIKQLYGDGDYQRRMVKVCAKYGKYFHEADGTYRDDAWQQLWDKEADFLKEYGHYMVFTQKNNIIRRQMYTQSAVMGYWLGGTTLAHGAWEDGGFYWQNAGFDGLNICKGERSGALKTVPRIFWNLMMVQGVARGCGIYSFDGQTLMYNAKSTFPPEPAALWDDNFKTTDTFKRYVAPLIAGVLEHKLVPTREEILENIKLAVYNDKKVEGDPAVWSHYLEYGPLYAGTYGFKKMGNIHGQLWEIFPNTGRYSFIPVLPQGNVPIGAAIRNLPVSELQDETRVRQLFDSVYPEKYTGDAFAVRQGNTLVVMNANENTDQDQSCLYPLNDSLIKSLACRIPVHSYLMGKVKKGGIWFQVASEYQDRSIDLEIACAKEPKCKVTPASAAREMKWDSVSGTLKLNISFVEGLAEVELE